MNLFRDATFLMIPSSVKEGKVFATKPEYNSNGDLTFTRASTATRVNSSGLIETSPRNLLQRSEEFDNAVWSKGLVNVNNNVEIAPNGTLTAEKIVSSVGTGEIRVFQSANTSTSETIETLSVYGKKSEFIWLGFRININGFWNQFSFNLNTGLKGTIPVSADIISSNISSVGNGWYRCSVTYKNRTNVLIQYHLQNADNQVNNTGNGTDGLFLWGAQLEIGSTVTDYVATTDRLNMPRLDYSQGGCPSLLLEPQRTNLFLFSNPASDEGVSSNITYESFNWANGFTSCVKFGNNSVSRSRYGGTCAPSTLYTLSFYVRMDDLSEPIVGQSSLDLADFVPIISGNAWLPNTKTHMGNNIWRITATGTSNSSGGLTSNGLVKYTSGTNKGFRVTGFQLEAGAFSTSLILTTGSTVTRVADSYTRNNVFTNNLISSQGGTWFVELVNNVVLTRDAGTTSLSLLATDISGFTIKNNGGSTRLAINLLSSGGATITAYTTLTNNVKICIKWNGSTSDVFVNGVKVVLSASFTSTTMENLNNSSIDVPKYIKQMALWNKPLTDGRCYLLTSGLSYDSDSAEFIVAAGLTDTTQINAIDKLVKDLKAFGIWSKMKAIYPFVGGTANSHKFNLKDPRDLDAAFRLQFFGGITHDANGMWPNGTNGYANTFLRPNTNLTQNNTHLSVYSRTDQLGGVDLVSEVNASSRMSLFVRTASNTIESDQYNDSTGRFISTNNSSIGHFIGSRTSSISLKAYRNGSQLGSTVTTSGGTFPNAQMLLGSYLGSALFSSKQYAFATIGDGLTDSEATNLYNIVQAYQTTLNRQV